ncbi:PBSX family phage terminase large subunit [Mycobacteroides abscessus]|uniref:PBSX family phage terminase large subunit n=1 Tax=unclassified Desemzia TaxID=2685243 RepID=UPI0009A665E2|nr:Bacteriophage terminase large (ATPase) subunit and inactivated derivatives [Mycobacteroides abscessus subsp. abscessus]
MAKTKKANIVFKFTNFSKKQMRVLSWWQHPSFKNLEAIICDGSVRAGKTLIMSLSFILWAMTEFKEEQFGMAGKTIGSFRRNVLRTLKIILWGRGYKVHDNRSENILTVSKGDKTNYFFIFGGKDESSQDLVQGITLAGFFFDEAALMPQSFVNQATARCSVDGSKLWFNMNPEGPYHWFKTEWIDKAKEKLALHIHFTMDDNPSLSERVKNRYKRMYSGVFFQRFILGLWVMSEGIIYDNFDQETMVVDIPKDMVFTRHYISVDYGTLNPTAFLLWGQNKDTWYCRDEYYHSGRDTQRQKTDEQYVKDMNKFVEDHELSKSDVRIIVDPSAASFITALRNDGYVVEQASNDVLDGIRATASAMNEGLIKFSRKCKNVIQEFSSYRWDDKASLLGKDKPIKEHDHAMDALRYFVFKVVYRKGTFSFD